MAASISENQSEFVEGCQIFDNVIVGFKGTHTIRLERFRSGKCEALKLDMSKAYVRVE